MKSVPDETQKLAKTSAEDAARFVSKGSAFFKLEREAIPRDFHFLMLPKMTMLAFSAAVEPLRIANQLTGQCLYRWYLLTEEGTPVRCSNGISIVADNAIGPVGRQDTVFICSGVDGYLAASEKTLSWIRLLAQHGRTIGGLCTGAFIMLLACAIIPSLSTDLPFAPAADTLALVGVFGLARIFISLAAMDVGTSFGSLGGRREMLVGFLAEPALLMVIFTTAMISQSTSVATIVETLAHRDIVIYPSLAFAGIAFTFVSLAENARVPVDNPATHLELTMIHEAMILEYSGRHLALIEWAASLKLYAYSCLGLALFFPWGIAERDNVLAMVAAVPLLLVKLGIGGFLLATIETVNAKMRIFRAPEFLGTAFLLAVLGLLVRLLLEIRA